MSVSVRVVGEGGRGEVVCLISIVVIKVLCIILIMKIDENSFLLNIYIFCLG